MQVYNRSVTDPARLNRYKGWSEEVYGEFATSMISEIVQKVPIKANHRFVDLGSGAHRRAIAACPACSRCRGTLP
jgi:hypothetical protein